MWPRSRPRLIGLTGSQAEIAQAVRAYRVYASKAAPRPPTAAIWSTTRPSPILMGGDGKYLTHFGHDTTPEEMAQTHRRNGRRGPTALASRAGGLHAAHLPDPTRP